MLLREKSRVACLATVLLACAGTGAVAAGTAEGPRIYTMAGSSERGFGGDGGPNAGAIFNGPRRLVFGQDGILVADVYNHRVRKLGYDGKVTTVAGTGVPGDSGDGGPAVAAQLNQPASVVALADGGFLVADRENSKVRKVSADGSISTVAGGRREDRDDDEGPRLEYPQDLSLTAEGGFLVADARADRVLEVKPNGNMRSVAGTGRRGFSGDGGPAVGARLSDPRGLVALPGGGFLVADSGNDRVRRVDPDGRISTVAGTGVEGFSGDGGPANAAQLNTPVGLALIPGFGYLIADRLNHRVRYVSEQGTIDTFVGTGEGAFNGDEFAPALTHLNEPRGMAVAAGLVLIADATNNRVRLWYTPQPPPEPAPATTPAEAAEKMLPPPAPPVAGKRVNAAAVAGKVRVKLPGADGYTALGSTASIPVGSIVDATRGTVRITSAADLRGRTQAANFYDGAFVLRQRRERRPVTELVLSGGDFSSCARGKRARTGPAAGVSSRRARRGLWGRGKGRFRTRGRNGSATVRGTIWFTQDRCDGTFVRVRRGVVAVRELAGGRKVLVRAGRSYLAKPRGSQRRKR